MSPPAIALLCLIGCKPLIPMPDPDPSGQTTLPTASRVHSPSPANGPRNPNPSTSVAYRFESNTSFAP